MSRNIVFINLTQHSHTRVQADPSDFVRRVDHYTKVKNPVDPDEINKICTETFATIKPHLIAASNAGDKLIIALPGVTLLAAGLVIQIWHNTDIPVGIVAARRDGDGYIFDLTGSRILTLEDSQYSDRP